MSKLTFFDINSTYRDRNTFPSPSEFQIPISQTGTKNKTQAVDGVSLQSAEKYWAYNLFNKGITAASSHILSGTIIADRTTDDYHSLTTGLEAIVSFTKLTNEPVDEKNYYKNATIATGPTSNLSDKIDEFQIIEDNMASILVYIRIQTKNTALLTLGSPISIYDPSSFDNGLFFVPNSNNVNRNLYTNCYVYNQRTNEALKQESYIEPSSILRTETNGTGWMDNDVISLRKDIPSHNNIVNTTTYTNPITTNNISFFLEQLVGDIRYDFLELIQENSNVGDISSIEKRRITNFQTLSGNITLPFAHPTNKLTLPSSASNITNTYNNLYIKITDSLANEYLYLIKTYDGDTKIAVLDTNLNPAIASGDNFEINSGVVEKAFSYSPMTTTITLTVRYLVLRFTRDNFSPFNYNGSMISQQQSTEHQIELLHLILPNRSLKTGNGMRIAYYPFVYVELSNVSSTASGFSNYICSNNPNSNKMVFKVPITDTQSETNTFFTRLNGSKMIQYINFKSNDNLKFSVRLPNGELLETVDGDYYSPSAPNDCVQISALFSVKRIV